MLRWPAPSIVEPANPLPEMEMIFGMRLRLDREGSGRHDGGNSTEFWGRRDGRDDRSGKAARADGAGRKEFCGAAAEVEGALRAGEGFAARRGPDELDGEMGGGIPGVC